MKKKVTEALVESVFEQLEELARVDRGSALDIVEEINSFLSDYDLSDTPQVHIDVLIGLGRFYVNGRETAAAEAVLQRAMALAQEHNITDEIIRVQSIIAIIYSIRGDHYKSISIWEDMLQSMDPSHPQWIPITNNLAVAYGSTTQYTKAVDLCYKMLEVLDENQQNLEFRISVLINLGNAYRPLKSFDKAFAAYQEALHLALQTNSKHYLSNAYSHLANTLLVMKRYDEALKYAQDTLEINRSFYGNEPIADALCLVASICNKLGRYDEAESHLKEALELFDPNNDKVSYIEALSTLAETYLSTDRYTQSLELVQKAHELSLEVDVLQIKLNIYRLQTDLYAKMGEHQNAFESLQKLSDLQDAQYTQLSENLISKQEAEFLRRKIELQNTSYQQKNQELEESNKLIKLQTQSLEKTNQELHSSLAMLNRLISILSHDVRGPAANSAAALRLIADGEFPPDESQDLLVNVAETLEGLTDLLTEMMVWIESRSFSKGVDRLMHNTSLLQILEPVISLYRGQINQKHIELYVQLPPASLEIYTEPNILKIVLRNLLSNAIKFTPEGGSIRLVYHPRGKDHYLEISDNGVGMEAAELKSLLSHRLKPKHGTNDEIGMGMGLRLSLGYLKILGITFDAASQPGGGTSFDLRLLPAK